MFEIAPKTGISGTSSTVNPKDCDEMFDPSATLMVIVEDPNLLVASLMAADALDPVVVNVMLSTKDASELVPVSVRLFNAVSGSVMLSGMIIASSSETVRLASGARTGPQEELEATTACRRACLEFGVRPANVNSFDMAHDRSCGPVNKRDR